MIPNHFARMDNITQTVMEEQESIQQQKMTKILSGKEWEIIKMTIKIQLRGTVARKSLSHHLVNAL